MTTTDEAFFDFDASRLADFDRSRAEHELQEHGEVYRDQLVAAHWIDGFRERLVRSSSSITGTHGPQWIEGFEYTMREIAAHLRQGDLIPSGILYREAAEELRLVG